MSPKSSSPYFPRRLLSFPVPLSARSGPCAAPTAAEVDDSRTDSASGSKGGEVLEMTTGVSNFEYDQDNGGNLPADVKRLNGVRIRLRGFMIPLDQAEDVTQFSLVTSLDFLRNPKLAPQIQQTIIAQCPRDKPARCYPGLIIVEGTLTVAEKKDVNYICSLFTSV